MYINIILKLNKIIKHNNINNKNIKNIKNKNNKKHTPTHYGTQFISSFSFIFVISSVLHSFLKRNFC